MIEDTDLRRKISGRIAALLINDGFTEAEAMLRVEKARELMVKYNIDLGEAGIRNSKIFENTFDRSETWEPAPVDHCHEGIERLCGVKIMFKVRPEKTMFGKVVKFRLLNIIGAQSDIEFAHYLYDMVDATIEVETDTFKTTPIHKHSKHKEQAVTSFQLGMAARINTRLLEMARGPQLDTTGKDLVVVKNEVVEAAFAAAGYKVSTLPAVQHKRDDLSANAGAAAGDRANLSRPIGHEEQRLIQ